MKNTIKNVKINIRKEYSGKTVLFKYRERMMIENSMFYMNFEASSEQQESCIEKIKEAGSDDVNPIYLLKKPIIDKKADYDYKDAFVVLMPKHKMIFINFGDEDDFEEFQEDFIEDMGYISKKYDFIGIVGRPRKWQKEFVTEIQYSSEDFSFKEILRKNELTDKELIRRGDILISLATGSINEAERLGVDVPNNILDQIKRKIILFDGEQTKFIFDEPKKKRITIQGLAGTGKTELLLHKIKELYIDDDKSTIVRNSIYMMLTRSFLTSYLILPDTAKNINLLEEGIGFVNRKGFLKVEEPSDDEKRNLANAIINRGNLHKSLFQKAEEIMDEMGVVDKEHRDMIHQLIRVRFKNKENDENKLRKFIQANSGALE